ncbi:MAG: amidohydrolase family protein [Candidatus Latescibacteria bacterium]|nr:amidohydrolase family protein [Candidatus Latescibacterota bacterium]
MIVDSHCHTSPYWYEPVESLLYQMDHNGVEKAVLIQLGGQFDNTYQSECVRGYPDRLTSVVIVDSSRTDACELLEREAELGAVGIRLGPDVRSPDEDPLVLWKKVDSLGLSVSCAGRKESFASSDFADLVEQFPTLQIVIEHLGNVNQPEGGTPQEQILEQVFGLARFPNVSIKIHGLGEFAAKDPTAAYGFPFENPLPALLPAAYDAFGAERMMWGSDYPPVSGREGYSNALRWTKDQLADLSIAESQQIFGGVAERIFGNG